jgi:hypothetical protein
LPTQMGPVRFVRHTLHTGEPLPPGFSDELGRALLRAAGSGDSISVAWIDPVPEHADATGGMTLVAIRIPGMEAHKLRTLAAVAALLVSGASGSIGRAGEDRRSVIFAGDTVVMSSGDTMYVVSYPRYDPGATSPPATGEPLRVSDDDLFESLPKLDLAWDPEPARPWPSSAPRDTPVESDPASEALLPDVIRGATVEKVSARGASLLTSDYLYVVLPLYALHSGGLDLDVSALAAAGGHPDGLSSFWIVVAPVRPNDEYSILAAWFQRQLGGFNDFETVESGGRVAVVYHNQAVHVRDGVLYWMTYLDLGDFPSASPAPRPVFRDLVLDALEALP